MSKEYDLDFIVEQINERLKVYQPANSLHENSFAEDVKIGLTSADKFLMPKYFYDDRGSELFEKICETDEYYPTRTEITVLKNLSDEISKRNIDKNLIIELGSGSSLKTDYLLNSFLKDRETLTYVPIDVSNILIESSRVLIEKYKNLYIKGVISFYEEGMEFIVSNDSSPKLVLFLGSSIGNFTSAERIDFMKMLKKYMNEQDRLIIGFDLKKDIIVLESAYNDKDGITAEFNLNILRRINEELGSNFDLTKFEHNAFYSESESRIEMHLRAKEKMEVSIRDIDTVINFDKGEKIHTENSYKFDLEMIRNLAKESGMEFSDYFTDENNYFSLCTFRTK